MKTIRPLTSEDLAALRAEPQSSLLGRLLPTRIYERIRFHGQCWRVEGWNTGNGFANIEIGGKTFKVHRVIYTLLVGPIPKNHLLDHRKDAGCRWRDCCNPGHLEPVLTNENTRRGDAVLFKTRPCYAQP